MARQEYKSTQAIHDMTARQLREYIYVHSREAQERLDTIKERDRTRAFNDLADQITGRGGKVKKSTSYMSKEEMREYAYALRDFNRYDTKSTYARNKEYESNKDRFETFIKNRSDDPYWKKFIKKDGTVSKTGYKAYKNYVNFIKSTADLQKEFEYETIKRRGDKALGAKGLSDLRKKIDKAYSNVMQMKEKDPNFIMTPAKFQEELDHLMNITPEDGSSNVAKPEGVNIPKIKDAKPKKTGKKKKPPKIPKVKTPKKKSSQNIKAKTGGKMKERGKIR